jgi:alpha-1,2-mannosyltransferase
MRTVPSKPVTSGVLVAAAVVVAAVVVSIWRESPPAFGDLDVYRLGVRTWWHGGDLYGVLPVTIAGNHLPFIYPPFAVLVLGPITMLPWSVSAGVMLVVSLAALVGVVGLSLHNVWPGAAPRTVVAGGGVVVALSMALEPVRDTLWFGQVNLLLMLLVALDCLPARTRWPRGLLVGIAAAVKLTPAVFVLYFLLRKDYRAAATATVTTLGATALGFLLSWHGSLEFWFGSGKGARTVSGSAYFQNQTVAALLARLPLSPQARTALWLSVVAGVLVVAAIGIRVAHRWEHRTMAMSLTGCLGLIASPTSWGHHWVYVVPGVLAIAGHVRGRHRPGWAIAGVVTVATFTLEAYQRMPHDGTAQHHWTLPQQLLGNSYVIVGTTLMALFALRYGRTLIRRPGAGTGDEEMFESRYPVTRVSA